MGQKVSEIIISFMQTDHDFFFLVGKIVDQMTKNATTFPTPDPTLAKSDCVGTTTNILLLLREFLLLIIVLLVLRTGFLVSAP